MERIRKYFNHWNGSRIIRLILAGASGMAYYENHETLYLFAAIVLGAQIVFNLSCAGGSCGSTYKSKEKPTMEFKKYEPKEF